MYNLCTLFSDCFSGKCTSNYSMATLQCWWSPWSQHYNGESMKSTSQCGVYEVESIKFTLPCGLNEVYFTMWNGGSLKFFLQGSINWNWHDNMECDLEHRSLWSLMGSHWSSFYNGGQLTKIYITIWNQSSSHYDEEAVKFNGESLNFFLQCGSINWNWH